VSVLTDDVAVLTAAVAAFVPAKIAATAQMVAMRDKAAAGQPITLADVAALITLFNAVTEPSNALRAAATNVAAGSAAVTVGMTNLTDAAVAALDVAPVKDYAAAYAVLANVLIFCPDKSTALGVVDALYADLKIDIGAYYDAIPDGPVPALIVNSMNALDAVLTA
jgi:hypothetical protein